MNPINIEIIANQLLQKFRIKAGQSLSPAKLAKMLKCFPEDIIKAILILRSWGYIIKADKTGQYKYISAPDSYLAAEIGFGLKTKFMGKKIYSYRTVQSTNTIASQLAAVGVPEGTLIIAENQTRGKGRLGRRWYSPEKVGLYCSLILYPKIHPSLAPGLSLVTAAALTETIASYDDIDVKIKWPNDVLISGLKVAGILTELSAEIDRIAHVVVGIGVNINQKRSDFPSELQTIASSIRIGYKEKINRVEFLRKFLSQFEKEYIAFKKSGLAEARKKVLKYSFLQGKEVKFKLGRKTMSGTVIDVDTTGRLVLDTPDGIIALNAGEVTTQ
jgi:BirA family biotin operon repressor/biotin-[acetyl-CoA-carboxylase] ligase